MTADGRREQNIRLIIDMEDRINQCNRCKSLLSCNRKPSMGKGDLEPDIIIIFKYDGVFTRDLDKLIALREIIKSEFGTGKIYHTFMVRCQPKACTVRNNTACYVANNKLIDKDNNCLLTGKPCEGIPIKPSDDDIINCLPFLLEELEILNPKTIILFGERVSEFVLKSYGIYKEPVMGNYYYNNTGKLFLTVSSSEEFTHEECRRIIENIPLVDNMNQSD